MTCSARTPLARRAALVAAGALTCTAALAACTSASAPPAPTSRPTTRSLPASSPVAHSSSTAGPTPGAPTSSAPSSSGRPTRASTSASASSTSAPPSSSAQAAGPAPCANGQLRTTAAQAGALPGEEIAILTFTDTSPDRCTVTGFPGVELLARGRVLGKPAVRSSLAVRTLVLAPNQAVTARLTDDTRCDAPLSDTIGIYPPNQTVQVRLPLKLRGCALTVDPVRR